jgi:hypothetical protein
MTDVRFQSQPKNVFPGSGSSLGYFVDIYDLLVFSIVRVKSLTDIGVHVPILKPGHLYYQCANVWLAVRGHPLGYYWR